MPNTDRDRAIALTGLFQATSLVRDIARDGQCDNTDFATCIDSLFMIDAHDSGEVYGGLPRLRSGLQLLNQQLTQPHDPELTRYVWILMVLERKLARQPQMLQTLSDGIQATRQRLDHFQSTHENIIAGLADLYAATISNLKPRIMVNGHYQHLSRPDNANRIRALLLAGIRAAVLWRQNGGGRLKLLFGRKRLLLQTQRLLTEIPSSLYGV